MGKVQNLHDVMNVVTSHLEMVLTAPRIPSGVMSELEVFACEDGLLADLQKQFMDAKDHHRRAVKEYGPHDGMTEMAILLEDSAWCAMQTRYMEVRSNRALMKKVQAIMEEQRIAAERAVKAEAEKEALYQYRLMQTLNASDKRKDDEATGLLLFLMMHNQMHMPMFRVPASYSFNRLAA